MAIDISEDNLREHTLGLIKTLVREEVSSRVLWYLFLYIGNKKRNPNEYKKALDIVSRLADTYRGKPEVLDRIIYTLTFLNDPDKDNLDKLSEILFREDVKNLISDVYGLVKERYPKQQEMVKDVMEEVISLVLKYPESLNIIIKRVSKNPELKKMIIGYDSREILASLTEAERMGLLRKDEVESYLGRIAQIIKKIDENLHIHPVSIDDLLAQIYEITNNIERAISGQLSSENLRKNLEEILRDLESRYSDENIKYLIELENRMGLSQGVISGLAYEYDSSVFRELLRLLNKDDFITVIRSLRLYGEEAIADAIYHIGFILAEERAAKEYIPKRFIIEEAVEKIVKMFGTRPYFPDLLHMTLVEYDLTRLSFEMVRAYLEVITSPSFRELLDSLYRGNWKQNIKYVKEDILPFIETLIREFGEKGVEFANEFVKALKGYKDLDQKVIENAIERVREEYMPFLIIRYFTIMPPPKYKQKDESRDEEL